MKIHSTTQHEIHEVELQRKMDNERYTLEWHHSAQSETKGPRTSAGIGKLQSSHLFLSISEAAKPHSIRTSTVTSSAINRLLVQTQEEVRSSNSRTWPLRPSVDELPGLVEIRRRSLSTKILLCVLTSVGRVATVGIANSQPQVRSQSCSCRLRKHWNDRTRTRWALGQELQQIWQTVSVELSRRTPIDNYWQSGSGCR